MSILVSSPKINCITDVETIIEISFKTGFCDKNYFNKNSFYNSCSNMPFFCFFIGKLQQLLFIYSNWYTSFTFAKDIFSLWKNAYHYKIKLNEIILYSNHNWTIYNHKSIKHETKKHFLNLLLGISTQAWCWLFTSW